MPQVTLSTDEQHTAPAPDPRGRRRLVVGNRLRKRTRWFVRCLLFLPLLTVLTALLLMRSPVVGWVAVRQLEAAVGCDAELESAIVTLDGRIVLRGLSMRVPGMNGAQAEFLRAARAEIDADWSVMHPGFVQPTGIRLHSPHFRVSAGRDTSVLNIQSLHPTNPGALSVGEPVRIDVVSGVVELGEHTPTEYRVLREIGVSGELAPSESEPGVYQVRFQERQEGARRERAIGMMVAGRVDLQSSIAVIRLLNVDLTAWEPGSVPSLLRSVWEQLNIKGRIASTTLEYFPTTGLTAVVTLDEVSMDAIVPANFSDTGPADDVLSLRKVHGTIKLSPAGLDADVAGLVENQTFPSRVILKTYDLDTDAALDCKIISRSFQLEKDPTLLPFCPPMVGDRLANFCGPTALLDADVVIRRGPPGPEGPADFRIAGWINFQNGVAAFDRVPYPFTQMRGRVEFDNDAINILHITGEGPNGSVLNARGRIAPPNHDAEVTIEVNVRNVPLDQTFLDSLPPSRAEAIDFLFNRARYDELLQAGQIAEPGAANERGVPEFALGGRMNVDVVVRSPHGHDAPWTYTADVSIPRAGVLPRAFPFPIAAENIRLRLTDVDARLLAGRFAGLRGGTTDVVAEVILDVDGEPVIRPSVVIDAVDVPLDDLLLHAIAHASASDESGAGNPDGLPSPAAILRTMNLTGNVDCRAELVSTPEETIDFDIGVVFDELDARPHAPGSAPLMAMTDIAGSLRLTNTRIEAPRVTAALRALDGIEEFSSEIAPGADLGWIGFSLSGELSGIDTSLTTSRDEPRRTRIALAGLEANMELTGVNILAPFEHPIGAFAPDIAEKIVAVRSDRQPSGRVSASIDFAKPDAESLFQVAASLTAADNLMFNAGGEQFDATLHSGRVVFDSRASKAVRFENVRAEVGVGKAPRSVFGFDGSIFLDAPPEGSPEQVLRITGNDIAVESAPVSFALRHALSGENLATIAAAGPTGRFDAVVEVPSTILLETNGDPDLDRISATLTPRALAFDFEGSRVEINSFDGQLGVDARGIHLNGIVARAADWTARLNGDWLRENDGAGVLNARVGLEAASLTPGIRALLPDGLRAELDRIELVIDGPLHCDDAVVEYRAGGRSRIAGSLRFSGASLDVGAPLANAEGQLKLTAERAASPGGWSFGLDLEADRVEAAGLEMTDLRAHLDVGRNPGEVVLESLSADCYAGRVSATAHIIDTPNTAGARYDADITMAGVCFAPVLAALDSARLRSDGFVPEPMPTELITDPRRGRLDGTLAISGISGQTGQRSGVGSVRIADGDVVEMPLVLTLVQLSNFQVPSNDRLDFLQTIFHVHEDQVVFDQIDLLSSSVAIAGHGTMSWPDQELDLRFNSRAGTRVPLLSSLFETLRDEIATTRIRGTLADPRVGPEPLVGTRELIGNFMGDHAGVKRPVGLPDAAAERRRYRGQRLHAPQPDAPVRAPVQLLPTTAGVNPDR